MKNMYGKKKPVKKKPVKKPVKKKSGGLTAAQKKLPKALQMAMMKKKK
jgi:hypothetical protein